MDVANSLSTVLIEGESGTGKPRPESAGLRLLQGKDPARRRIYPQIQQTFRWVGDSDSIG